MVREFLRSVRRNHALEHATIAVLSGRRGAIGQLGGRAIHNGFYIYGPVPTPEVESAVQEALARLQHGEESLAISPFCGTNFLVASVLATVSAGLGLASGHRLQRFPRAMVATLFALLASFRLGAEVQRRWTTLPRPDGLAVTRVVRQRGGRSAVHRVYTTQAPS